MKKKITIIPLLYMSAEFEAQGANINGGCKYLPQFDGPHKQTTDAKYFREYLRQFGFKFFAN